MSLKRVSDHHDKFVKRKRLTDDFNDPTKNTQVLEMLHKEYRTDYRVHNDCLFEAVKADSPEAFNILLKAQSFELTLDTHKLALEIKSIKVGMIMIKCMGADIYSVLDRSVSCMLKGKRSMDRNVMIDMIVYLYSILDMEQHYDTIRKLFCMMVKLKSTDGVNRLLKELRRKLIEDASEDKIKVLYAVMIRTAIKQVDGQMSEFLYSLLTPFPSFLKTVLIKAFDGNFYITPAIFNPQAFLRYYNEEWMSEQLLDSFSEKLVDPAYRKKSTKFLASLASLLYIQTNSTGNLAETKGAEFAMQLMSNKSIEWMHDVLKHNDKMIETMNELLPKDLVILSLHYLVGQ
jgi:hypothetical protein